MRVFNRLRMRPSSFRGQGQRTSCSRRPAHGRNVRWWAVKEGTRLGDPVGPRTGRRDAWATHSGNLPVEGQSVLSWAISLLCFPWVTWTVCKTTIPTLCTHQVRGLRTMFSSAYSEVFFGKVEKDAQLVSLTLKPRICSLFYLLQRTIVQC